MGGIKGRFADSALAEVLVRRVRVVAERSFWENASGGGNAGCTGIACQDERNGVPWHNRGARSSTTLPEGIGKDFVRGTTAINDK
ncbi:MAG: hypothetical protein ACYC6Y_23680, partial [Thermoguttaceae bacterium]